MLWIILLGVVAFYLLCGLAIAGFAIYYMSAKRHENEEYKNQFEWWETAPLKLKAASVLIALWYGVICWLPIATGWMTRPTKFKF